MSPNPKLIEAILTNNTLSEEEKSKLIAEFIDNLQKEYPELKYHATKSDVKETELKLTKEIEEVRKEIKELDLKFTKEIENAKFTMIKWSFLFWISQFSAILFLIYKILK